MLIRAERYAALKELADTTGSDIVPCGYCASKVPVCLLRTLPSFPTPRAQRPAAW